MPVSGGWQPDQQEMNESRRHWEKTAQEWQQRHPQLLWRRHSDAVNRQLISQWWPDHPVESVLKTDLFDEAFGEGLYPFIDRHAGSMSGIDISAAVVSSARSRCPALQAVVADVRQLPFGADTFDFIVSNSSLDHFPAPGDIRIAVDELYRVLRPGGQMVLTMDNLLNPVIALRHVLPFGLLHSLGIAPYQVGSTVGPRGLLNVVSQAGFQVIDTSAVMHCPRVVAVAIAGLLQRRGKRSAQQRFLGGLTAFERLASLPTRNFTGHFVAVRVIK